MIYSEQDVLVIYSKPVNDSGSKCRKEKRKEKSGKKNYRERTDMMESYFNTRNPILPTEYHVPDSEAHVMPDGKLYIYGSYDNRDDVYCSEEYHVVSTVDMQNWQVHEVSLRGEDIPWFNDPDAPKYPGIDWTHPTPFIMKMLTAQGGDDGMKEQFENQENTVKPPLLFAPDCAYKNGKYYLYFCMPDDSEGVAVSDSPTGPFTDPVRLPVGGIDPAVFIDDDGSAYYYWGQLFSHGVKLNEDMVSFDPENIVDDLVTEEEHFFHEGSSMRKIGDTYYYVYANIEHGKPTSLGYATGKSPLGPFTYRGVIIDNAPCDGASWNNHGSIECVNGRWYIFYHRCSRGRELYRRLCIEPITILSDGTIPEVKMTSQGPGKPFGSGETLCGYQACEVHGKLFIAPDETGSERLTNIHGGDEAVFRYVKSEKGFHRAELECRGKGFVELLLDDQKVGEASIRDSGKTTISLTGSGNPGTEQELQLRMTESDQLEIISLTLFE